MMDLLADTRLPGWLPDETGVYLAHVVGGYSIRSLARRHGRHASTVLRQIRRTEQRRDDPLVDLALKRLSQVGAEPAGGTMQPETQTIHLDVAVFDREAKRILSRLSETGACLAVAEGMEKAVVVRETPEGQTLRTGVVPSQIAEAMALKGWIGARATGRLAKYRITPAGRAAYAEIVAREDSARSRAQDEDQDSQRVRYGQAETPLAMLARRRDRDGEAYLGEGAVRAGERLREDFELAEMGGHRNWDALLGGQTTDASADPEARGPDGAKARVAEALAELGPGLGDVTLRVCCRLEGLETVEKHMGWAARSGKIVLRIALDRLERHYASAPSRLSPMIG